MMEFPRNMEVQTSNKPLRIALVYSRMPLPMTRADQMTVAHLISFLAQRGHTVDLFTLDTGEGISEEQLQWLQKRCRRIESFRQGRLKSFIGLASALLRGR